MQFSLLLTQLVPFWTSRETSTWHWGPQAASHPPQVVPFPRDTLSAANSVELQPTPLNGAKGGLCYKRNYSCRPHLSISLPSELASSLMRRRQTRAIAVWGILNLHWQIWTAIVLLQWMYCMFVCRFFFTNSAWGPLVWIKFYFS